MLSLLRANCRVVVGMPGRGGFGPSLARRGRSTVGLKKDGFMEVGKDEKVLFFTSKWCRSRLLR